MKASADTVFFRRKSKPAPSFDDRLEALRQQGFTVETLPGAGSRVRVAKYGCGAVLEGPRFVEQPGVVIDGEIARLLDRGYQKFFLTSAGEERPALAEQLEAMHRFSEELRGALGAEMLYNQSLGTVSDRYVYDRLKGRE